MFELTDYWKILNYLGGTSVIDLDINTQILASSEQSVSLNLFENTIDQISYMSDDYKRLKNFLVNWYAANRTMVSTQKQAHDVFSLPDRDLSELLKSFGFIFSTTSLSFLTKANFFLDLVNLYKVKGTPQTLIDVLQYFGLSDIDLAEYWLEKDSSGNLVFKSERYLPPGVLDITFSNIYFDEMVRDDPHWRLSSSQVENLLSTNKIGLPSKSPYFSIRPRYNISTLKAVISIISRYVQDNYETYISGGTLTKDIKLTQLNLYASFLDLYMACVYAFNEQYERTTGSSDPLFYCYDGTNVPSIDVVISQYNNAVQRIGSPSSTENESRSAREAKILNFYDLFTRDMSLNFLSSYTTAGNILHTTNNELYDTIDVYISSGNGEELISYLMNDLNTWISSNIGAGYPNIATTVLGLGSLLEINKVINFFKPYHARMIKLEFALVINDPLLDSIVIEDQFYDNITEVVVDFDTADSTACIVCSDSTCESHYSREIYDCGSQFDIGASIDNQPNIDIEETIIDELNLHDATSSNAYDQILFTDATNFDSTATFCDGTGSLAIVLAGGWSDFDESGLFDSQHGNDLVQIYIEDFDCVSPTPPPPVPPGTAWTTTSSLTSKRTYLAGCGTTSDALAFGGYSGAYLVNSDIWDGSIWATTSNINNTRTNLAGCGTTSDALKIGGGNPGAKNDTEIWDGSIWTVTSSLNISRYTLSGCGNTSNALSIGGYSDVTEIWDGSIWSITSILGYSIDRLASCGTTSDALSFGGETGAGVKIDFTEIWNGSVWATTSILNVARDQLSGCGNTSYSLCFGGDIGSVVDVTEIWNGSSWTTTSSLIISIKSLAGCGTVSDALSFGGYSNTYSDITEIWL